MMRWWRKFWGADAEPEPEVPEPAPVTSLSQPAPAPAPVRPPARPPAPPSSSRTPTTQLPPTRRADPQALHTLRGFATGERVGAAAALAALRQLEGTSHERAALGEVSKAKRRKVADDDLLTRGAELHLARGELDAAGELLEQCTSLGALSLRAEICARKGDLGEACALLERVLARDIDAPGVRERLARLRERLGTPMHNPAPLQADGTLLTQAPADLPFRIVAEAGRGGAATVYQAVDDALGRTIALKVYLRPDADREQITREARLMVKLAGPGVLRVFDASYGEGWVALEWAPRGSLRDAMNARDRSLLLPVRGWLAPLVLALARVHAEGLVHGDIKPGNVLFKAPEAPLLSDFGQCKRQGEPFAGGTVGYLSPERLSGAPASPADDIYALGRVLDDVREALSDAGDEALARLGELVEACLSPARPRDAAALLADPRFNALPR